MVILSWLKTAAFRPRIRCDHSSIPLRETADFGPRSFIRRLNDCPQFRAGDGSLLRELANAQTAKHSFRYSIAHAVVAPHTKTKPHSLKTSEVYYILQGDGCMHVGKESAAVEAGCLIEVAPLSTQYIENTGEKDLVFLCIVDPGWRKEDESILEGQ